MYVRMYVSMYLSLLSSTYIYILSFIKICMLRNVLCLLSFHMDAICLLIFIDFLKSNTVCRLFQKINSFPRSRFHSSIIKFESFPLNCGFERTEGIKIILSSRNFNLSTPCFSQYYIKETKNQEENI